MISFTCNICGGRNSVETVAWEPPTCSHCRSNVRMRALIYLLSGALFGEARALPDFPQDRNIRGIGFSDEACYAVPLAAKFNYINTYYDRDPFLDLAAEHPRLYGTYDFILASDVFEHVAPPVARAFEEAYRLLKPNGVLCITVPSSAEDQDTVEYFPDLHVHSILELGGEYVLVNRKVDGSLEVHQNLEFHGGLGATLAMRMFSQKGLRRELCAAGFSEVLFQGEEVQEWGIFFEGLWGRPLVARRGDGDLPVAADLSNAGLPAVIDALDGRSLQLHQEKANLERRLATLETQLRNISDSRWLKLGERLGLGPKFE